MERPKRWQFLLILGVILLTVYNVLPTLFYYAQPLKRMVGEKEAHKTAIKIVDRVNDLETFTVDWLRAECKNIGVKPSSIVLDPNNPRLVIVNFKNAKDAALFARISYRAGALIPFTPAELTPDLGSFKEGDTTVVMQRKVGLHIDPNQVQNYFSWVSKTNDQGVNPAYQQLTFDRLATLAVSFAGVTQEAKELASYSADLAMGDERGQSSNEALLLTVAKEIVAYGNTFGEKSEIARRYFSGYTQIDIPQANKEKSIVFLTQALSKLATSLNNKIDAIQSQEEIAKREGRFLDQMTLEAREQLNLNKSRVEAALQIVQRNSTLFASGATPLTKEQVMSRLEKSFNPQERYLVVDIKGLNPFVQELMLDWKKENVEILLYPEVVQLRKTAKSEHDALIAESTNQLLYRDIAKANRTTAEKIAPSLDYFVISLSEIHGNSYLALDLAAVARNQIDTLIAQLERRERFASSDFSKDNFPIATRDDFLAQGVDKQKMGLFFYAPILNTKGTQDQVGFKNSSIYAVARGLGAIAKRYQSMGPSPEKERFEKDFQSLLSLMQQNGFIGYLAEEASLPAEYRNDYIFELDDFYAYLIAATRENFTVKGSHALALLEFTDLEQRLLTENRIDIATQENLLRWKDEYESAKASVDPTAHLYVPPPTINPFLANVRLATKLYVRGDDRKVLRWGLDLSGGKTVRVGLKDQSGRTITNEDDLKQATNELFERTNKLGVSEVSIRREGPTLVVDFPGSQGLSANDLVKASAMAFHIVNEKFTPQNPTLAEAVNAFLEEVWNEAVITGRKEIEEINHIAWQHLGGDPERPEEFHPLTPHARQLYDQGLRLGSPKGMVASAAFNDTLSKVALLRGTSPTDWHGQTHPLLMVFYNYALEGANLADIQTGYDPREGNVLSFSIKSSSFKEGERLSPRDDFYAWTSQFAEDKIAGTPKENYSQGRGWRMAVILNGSIVSAPTLNAALRDSARITGHFSMREINQLAADLKAGSLTFTPYILSEENVSPDLGQKQRLQGIMAAALGLVLVVVTMCAYYRFGGVVASVAVLFNLLIIWGVLQNLGAAITLPNLAGIILAVGMSVDANVLVFERIREEFAISKKLSSALFTGYRKAFSAIVDSNLTTIIAALILLNFDSGPIKGFALTLIIGIVSSMFTSLFMTRYFFSYWIQNPKHKVLAMMHLFKKTSIDFLSKAKLAYILSAIGIVVGLLLFYAERKTVLGMDFTGGYALTVDLKEREQDNYRMVTEEALSHAGLSTHDFQIRELSRPNELRIQLSAALDEKGKPFYGMDRRVEVENALFAYQQNARITWIVSALTQGGVELNPQVLNKLHLQWTEMSGQLSDTMRNQAIFGLVLALIAILIYITLRFEFKYAMAATLGLVHDVLLTLALFALIHLAYPGLVLDLQVIAALMTIIGYSLNDTIIVFDRIREDLKIHRKSSFEEIVNGALNTTLSRTIMTSGTTLVALMALVLFGGRAIFNFSFVMAIGVLLGTLSSLYIASPLLVYFHKREKRQEIASQHLS